MTIPSPDAFVQEKAAKEANDLRRWTLIGQAFDQLFSELRDVREQLTRIENMLAGDPDTGQKQDHVEQ